MSVQQCPRRGRKLYNVNKCTMNYPQSICVQLPSKRHFNDTGKQEIDLIKPVKDFDFGSSLLATYDVLEEILEFLPYSDLQNLAKICPVWCNRIGEYLKKRLMPHIFYFTQNSSTKFKNVGDNRSIKPLCSLTFFNDTKLKLHYYVCMHQGSISSIFKKPVVQFLEENILANEKCPVLALSCRQSENSIPPGLFFNGIVFPTIPDVNVSVIRISKANRDDLPAVYNQHIGSDNIIHCLLAFTYPLRKDGVSKRMQPFMNVIQERQDLGTIALGGGLVTGVKTFNVVDLTNTKRTDDVLFVTFYTPKTADMFNAYSMKITEEMINNNEVENFFNDFKKYFKRRKYSVALRFSCTSLDEQYPVVEELFQKHFPDVGISGFSCNGEIGWNKYREEDDSEPAEKKIKLDKTFLNYFTIIFVIFSWGKII